MAWRFFRRYLQPGIGMRRIAVMGAAGRMGKILIEAVNQAEGS